MKDLEKFRKFKYLENYRSYLKRLGIFNNIDVRNI